MNVIMSNTLVSTVHTSLTFSTVMAKRPSLTAIPQLILPELQEMKELPDIKIQWRRVPAKSMHKLGYLPRVFYCMHTPCILDCIRSGSLI